MLPILMDVGVTPTSLAVLASPPPPEVPPPVVSDPLVAPPLFVPPLVVPPPVFAAAPPVVPPLAAAPPPVSTDVAPVSPDGVDPGVEASPADAEELDAELLLFCDSTNAESGRRVPQAVRTNAAIARRTMGFGMRTGDYYSRPAPFSSGRRGYER